MGEYFLIANDEKEQFLDPFELPASDRFPSIMTSPFISNAILWLTCNSNHSAWTKLKVGPYSEKYIGLWSGAQYLVYGDYEAEEHSREIRGLYSNISVEIAAMMLEIPTGIQEYLGAFSNGDNIHLKLFSKIALLENAPSTVIKVFNERYGSDWKAFASNQAYN